MEKTDFTVKEHYVPRFYLNRFADDDHRLYLYDVLSEKKRIVSTSDICFRKNLYEFCNESGGFKHRNILENILSALEGMFSAILKSIDSKSCKSDNFKTLCFLDSKEKAVLTAFIATMITRNPKTIKLTQDLLMDYYSNVSKNTSRNIALNNCLPFLKELNPDEQTLFKIIVDSLDNMAFQIHISEEDAIWICDTPAAFFKDENYDGSFLQSDHVVFPLAPNLVLYMIDKNKTPLDEKNRLIIMTRETIDYFNEAMIINCNRWIYSKNDFSEKDIKWIKKKIKNRRSIENTEVI